MNKPEHGRKHRAVAEQHAVVVALGRATLRALGLDPDDAADVSKALDATRKTIRQNRGLQRMAQAIATIQDYDERAIICAQLIGHLEALPGFDADEFSRLCGFRQSEKKKRTA
jgi:hypothetical protein